MLALSCLAAAGLLVYSAPALALAQRGHHFEFAFDEGGGAKAVAVNESLSEGNVYVGSGERVNRFTCTATGCVPFSSFNVKELESIAIDNSNGPSHGHVYVATEEKIYRYNVAGEKCGLPLEGYKEGPGEPEPFGEIHGIAVDAKGDLWVDHESSVTEFNGNNVKTKVSECEGASTEKGNEFIKHEEPFFPCFETPGFAVGPDGESLYIGQEPYDNRTEECEEELGGVIMKFSGDGVQLNRGLNQEPALSVAVDLSNGSVYVGNVNKINAYQAGGALIQQFGNGGEITRSRGVAIDSKDDQIYVADFDPENLSASRVEVFAPDPPGPPSVDSISSENLAPKAPPLDSARLNAQVDPNGFETAVSFEYGTVDCRAGAPCASAPVQRLGPGFGDQPVSVELTNLQPGTRYFFRVTATSACGSGSCTSARSGIIDTLPASTGLLADGRAWEMVSPPEKFGAGIEAIGGIGGESVGPSGGPMQASEDGNKVTYDANAPIVEAPVGNKAPAGTQVLSTRTAAGWVSEDLVTASRRADAVVAGGPNEYRVFSSDLSAAILRPEPFSGMQEPPLVPGQTEEESSIYIRHNSTCQSDPATCYLPFVTAENIREDKEGHKLGIAGEGIVFLDATPDLSHGVFSSQAGLQLSKPEEPGLYEWGPERQLQLVSRLPGPEEKAAPETSTLGDFTPGSSELNTRHAISNDGSRVFWSTSAPAQEEGSAEGNRIYMRDTVAHTTVQVNAPITSIELSVAESEEEEARFQTANDDGSHVFFTDTVRLTSDSTLKPPFEEPKELPADLYEWTLAGSEGCSASSANWTGTGCLTDITAHSSQRSANVQQVVPGASDDGSYVYFVANGVLTQGEGAEVGDCADNVPSETCGLYVSHLENGTWTTRFIATLSANDGKDWAEGARLVRLTSRVSPNGRFLAFMSERPLTGYENVDASEAAHGAKDEEVFLYDWTARHLTCVSCKSGVRPEGVFDTEDAGEGVGLAVDRPGLWEGHWLGGNIPGWTPLASFIAPRQSRYLDDEGRLFFNSPEQLVTMPEGEQFVHKENVYEYEPTGVGSCGRSGGCVSLLSSGVSDHESAFIDATPTGNDVFFITARQLLPQDKDQSFDLYDARVCTDSSPCLVPPSPPPPPCSGEASCRPPGSSSTSFGSPGTTVQGASGNTAQSETRGETVKKKKPTRKELLAKALKKCRTKYRGKSKKAKHRRAVCERQARSKYGTKHASKHSKKGKR